MKMVKETGIRMMVTAIGLAVFNLLEPGFIKTFLIIGFVLGWMGWEIGQRWENLVRSREEQE